MGVVTSIYAKTFAAPPSAIVFGYSWDLSAADAAKATEKFQDFVQTNIPQEITLEVGLTNGSSKGRVNYGLTGGWYGPAEQFDAVIAPLLHNLPTPSRKSVTPGTFIESLGDMGGLSGRLNTSGIDDTRNTFYAKSIMTPEASPMTSKALNAFMSYLGDEGYTADTVR